MVEQMIAIIVHMCDVHTNENVRKEIIIVRASAPTIYFSFPVINKQNKNEWN